MRQPWIKKIKLVVIGKHVVNAGCAFHIGLQSAIRQAEEGPSMIDYLGLVMGPADKER